jgi:class I lanthipeptide synthase
MHGRDAPGTSGAPTVSAAGASWRPILQGPSRDRALEAVNGLARWIDDAQQDGTQPGASLSGGAAGLSLFFAQLARAGHIDRAEAATRWLDDAIETLATTRMGASLYAGFTGVAWAVDVVGRLLDEDAEDRNEAIDDALLAVLGKRDWESAPYDLIHGLTGLGVYALDRWPRATAVESVTRVVTHLAKRARHDEVGTYWWTGPSLLVAPRRQEHPRGGVDLGVAHGIAGVIPFLAQACSLGAADASVEMLLDETVRWLFAQAVEGDSGPTIPSFVADGVAPQPTRSAWCYGDPGVAAALLIAARAVGEWSWFDRATDLAVHAAERPPSRSGVADAGFCHGSAGLAHLFNRMFQLTGEPKLADVSLFWLEQTLKLCTPAGGESPAVVRTGPQLPWNGLGILEGAAGIGLVLLAASTSLEPLWDRMFLVSRLTPDAVTDEDED